jgi:hypothetical protein
MKPTTQKVCAPLSRLVALGILGLCAGVAAADTGQKAQAATQSIRAVNESVVKQGQDFHVVFIRPGRITAGPPPASVTRTLRVDFETYAPNRKIKAAAQYSNGRVITRLPCGTFAEAGRHTCDIALPGIGADIKSITIGMVSAKADAPSGVYETALTFVVPVVPLETEKQISPAAKQARDAQQARPERVEVKGIRSAADLPAMLRDGDPQALNPQPIPPGKPVPGARSALNPQPIPPGRDVLMPKNPGDPSPVVRSGDKQALNPQPIPPGRSDLHPVVPGSGATKPSKNPGDPPPVLRAGESQALNPQPIPPGRGELHPVVPGRGETKPSKNPGDPPPYTRSENTLYRVEVHSNESPGEPAPLRFSAGASSSAPVVTAKAAPTARPLTAGGGMEAATNRFGSDYRSLDAPDARKCQAACAGEAQCKAWTWVKPGVQGPSAKCWLKNAVPAVSKNDCCTSGVK